MDRNYAGVFAYLKRHPEMSKEDIAYLYSGGRTPRLSELSDKEYRKMMRELVWGHRERELLRGARSNALRLMQRYGVDTTEWSRVDAFVGDARIAGKPFSWLSIKELEELARKLRAMLRKKRAIEESVQAQARAERMAGITGIKSYNSKGEA